MDAKERNELLTRLDERTTTILKRLDKMPCEAREKRIGKLEVQYSQTKEKVETHNKFIWATIITSISSVIGLVFLGVKMLLSSAITGHIK